MRYKPRCWTVKHLWRQEKEFCFWAAVWIPDPRVSVIFTLCGPILRCLIQGAFQAVSFASLTRARDWSWRTPGIPFSSSARQTQLVGWTVHGSGADRKVGTLCLWGLRRVLLRSRAGSPEKWRMGGRNMGWLLSLQTARILNKHSVFSCDVCSWLNGVAAGAPTWEFSSKSSMLDAPGC